MKFMLIILGMVLVMGLSLVLFTNTVLYHKLQVTLEKRGLSLARNIARESVNPVLTERFLDLALMLREVRNEETDIEYIYVRNARGEVVAHTFENGFPLDLQKEYPEERKGRYSARHLSTERGLVYEYLVPLLTSGGAATVHLGMSQASVERDINDIMAMIIGAIAALFLGGSVVAALFVSSVTKPIHLLAVAAQALERGDMHARVPVRSSDELGQLALTFNRMAETRMQFEATILAGERKLRNITSHLAEGIYVLDQQGKITFMNPEAERLLGWTREELNEKGAHSLVHYRKADGTLLPSEACEMHDVVLSGKNYMSADEVFVRKDGTVFPIAVVTSPIWEEGKVVSAVTAFRDISRQKELEQERSQLILAYEDALNNIKTLKGLVPICASCKKIRDDKGFWNHLEVFIQQRTDAEFSHGICPACAKKLYPGFVKKE
jgi:PAS domain S-box-containing protein